jgi:hypothetical protein
MRHTSPRRADVATLATDSPTHQITAWLSHDAERKAYVLTIVPEELERRDGYTIRRVTAYSGRRVCIEGAPRFSARRLAELAADPGVRAYVDAFAAAYTPSTEA